MRTPNGRVAAEQEFSRYHSRLRSEINTANWHFAIWKYVRKIKNDYLYELNQAPAFFGLTRDAHLLSTLMRINKFFDRRREHLSIRNFLDFVEENLDIFSKQAFAKRLRQQGRYDAYFVQGHAEITPQKVEQDREKVNQLPVSHIRAWRNKVLAHIETASVLRDINIMKEYPVKSGQIDDVINTLHAMLNDYSVAYDGITWEKDLALEHGIQTIVDAIRFESQQRRKALKSVSI